jgi:hypothetical protein
MKTLLLKVTKVTMGESYNTVELTPSIDFEGNGNEVSGNLFLTTPPLEAVLSYGDEVSVILEEDEIIIE